MPTPNEIFGSKMLTEKLFTVGSELCACEAKLLYGHAHLAAQSDLWLAIRLPELIDRGKAIAHIAKVEGQDIVVLVERSQQEPVELRYSQALRPKP